MFTVNVLLCTVHCTVHTAGTHVIDVEQATIETGGGEYSEKDEVAEEVGMVLLPDTVTNPRTVVVKPRII